MTKTKIHMKSGKTFLINMCYADVQDLINEHGFDTILVPDIESELILHAIPKENIESLTVFWTGTREELDELTKEGFTLQIINDEAKEYVKSLQK